MQNYNTTATSKRCTSVNAYDRMSCSSFRANTFRLFLYGAAYVIAHRLKALAFAGTEVEDFTIDSFIKRIITVR